MKQLFIDVENGKEFTFVDKPVNVPEDATFVKVGRLQFHPKGHPSNLYIMQSLYELVIASVGQDEKDDGCCEFCGNYFFNSHICR